MRDMDENGVFSLRGGRAHTISVENRERTVVTGVMDVESFNEEEIILRTSEHGILVIKGEELHINRLSVDTGDVSIVGDVSNMDYIDRSAKALTNGGENLFPV